MKKFLSIVIIAFAAASMASAAQVENVAIMGTISQSFSVIITPATIAGELILTEATATTNLVIAAAEFATNKNHWSIGVYSLNGGKLMGSTGESLAYTFSLGDVVGMQDLMLLTSAAPIYKSMIGKDPQFEQNMKISYFGDPLLQEGIYSDTIFLTISGD
ncbi:MAG: hypothetical protein RBT73_05240 [Spirochaetia bacterium]|nr:hypothetical protein [Spirochaetia bacterium]